MSKTPSYHSNGVTYTYHGDSYIIDLKDLDIIRTSKGLMPFISAISILPIPKKLKSQIFKCLTAYYGDTKKGRELHAQPVMPIWGGDEPVAPVKKIKKKIKATPDKPYFNPSDFMGLKQIAEEVGIDSKEARKILRKSNIQKPGARWEWVTGSDQIKKIMILLSK